jgi:lysozyme
MIDNILDQLRRDEGIRYEPYLDSRGISTVGCGHNLVADPLPGETYPLTDARVDQILKDDVARIWGKLQADLPWVKSLPDVIAGVLTNMSFNMGVGGLLGFKNTLVFVENGEYSAAADEILRSLWAKQVGARATRLAEQLRTGQWV